MPETVGKELPLMLKQKYMHQGAEPKCLHDLTHLRFSFYSLLPQDYQTHLLITFPQSYQSTNPRYSHCGVGEHDVPW